MLAIIPLLLACTTTESSECPEGSYLADDGLCYQDETTGGDAGATGDGGADGGTGDGGTSATLAVSDISVEVSEYVVTVARVSWTTETATTGWVEFGETDGYGLTTPITDSGTSHEVLLLGVPADTEVHFQVHISDGQSDGSSEDLTYTTGSLPSGLPSFSSTGTADQWNYQVIPTQGTTYVVAIVDNQGRYVWYDQLPAEGNLMRALISHDRQSMVYCLAGAQDDLSTGEVERVSMWGDERTTLSFPYIDHDMVELPDGTIGGITVTQAPDDGPYAGNTADSIVEMDADGNMTTVWSAWEGIDWASTGTPGGGSWTHGNGLDYVPEEDAYYLAAKTLGTIFKIDRATGETLWAINGQHNEFSFPDGTEMVELQHQFEVLDDGNTLLVFDNGTQDRGYSRIVEIAIDQDTLEAENVWDYIRDPSVFVFAKGDVARFDDDTRQVVWSASGEIQNVNLDGDVLWQFNTELGQAITFVQIVDDLYVR